MFDHQDLTNHIIGSAIEVHRKTGPGLLESVYAACLCLELERANIQVLQQVGIPVFYNGAKIPMGFRADLLIAETVIVEAKAVPALHPADEAQIQTYLRMSGLPIGLLLNFHAPRLKDALKRFANTPASAALSGPPRPPRKNEGSPPNQARRRHGTPPPSTHQHPGAHPIP